MVKIFVIPGEDPGSSIDHCYLQIPAVCAGSRLKAKSDKLKAKSDKLEAKGGRGKVRDDKKDLMNASKL